MDRVEKLGILADAAKYDASCSTSGSARANSLGGLGNGAVGGICHSWSADGRCVALLKVLLSNACSWDCAYCANRRSADPKRASFEPEELVRLIIDFYKRNYIEGALLSSGVLGCPDSTMERLVFVAKTLRERERFNGYLHLKVIPGSSESLVLEAARWADRVSVNIELPSSASLGRIAPDKSPRSIFEPMRVLARAGGFEPRRLLAAAQVSAVPTGLPSALAPIGGNEAPFGSSLTAPPPIADEPLPLYDGTGGPAVRAGSSCPTPRGPSVREARLSRKRDPEAPILPAGQTTQLVIGASPESDAEILVLAENLYLAYDVRRVYYSAFIPVAPDPRVAAPAKPPLLREHRLYQADWLFRFYGFTASEILAGGSPSLDEALDPKASWALRNLARFPVDVNRASYAELLRVPGLGPVSASRILRARRTATLRMQGLAALGVVMRRARPFLAAPGGAGPGLRREGGLDDPEGLRALLLDPAPAALLRGLLPATVVQPELDFGKPA